MRLLMAAIVLSLGLLVYLEHDACSGWGPRTYLDIALALVLGLELVLLHAMARRQRKERERDGRRDHR